MKNIEHLALPAYLAPCCSVGQLISTIFNSTTIDDTDRYPITRWQIVITSAIPSKEHRASQKVSNLLLVAEIFTEMMEGADDQPRARLHAVSFKESGVLRLVASICQLASVSVTHRLTIRV